MGWCCSPSCSFHDIHRFGSWKFSRLLCRACHDPVTLALLCSSVQSPGEPAAAAMPEHPSSPSNSGQSATGDAEGGGRGVDGRGAGQAAEPAPEQAGRQGAPQEDDRCRTKAQGAQGAWGHMEMRRAYVCGSCSRTPFGDFLLLLCYSMCAQMRTCGNRLLVNGLEDGGTVVQHNSGRCCSCALLCVVRCAIFRPSQPLHLCYIMGFVERHGGPVPWKGSTAAVCCLGSKLVGQGALHCRLISSQVSELLRIVWHPKKCHAGRHQFKLILASLRASHSLYEPMAWSDLLKYQLA